MGLPVPKILDKSGIPVAEVVSFNETLVGAGGIEPPTLRM